MLDLLPTLDEILSLLPGALAALLLLAVAVALTRTGRTRMSVVAAGLAPAFAFVVTWLATRSWSLDALPWSPVGSSDRVFWAVLGYCGVAVLAELVRPREALARGIEAIGATLVVWFCLKTLLAREPSSEDHVAVWTVGFVAVGFLVWGWALRSLALRADCRALAIALALTSAITGQIYVLFGGASQAQAVGTLSLVFVGAGLLGAVAPARRIMPAFLGAALGLVLATGLDARFFLMTPPPLPVLGLLAVAPLGVWGALLPRVTKAPGWKRTLLPLLVVTVLVGAAAVWGILEMPPEDPYSG